VTLLALAVSGRGVVDPDQPAVHADDEGFLRGRGAFETTRVYQGHAFRLGDHLERLAASARRLGLPEPPRRELERLVEEALAAAAVPDAFVRLYVTPGREGLGPPVALVLVGDLPDDLEARRSRGIGLITVPLGLETPALLGGVKSTSYAVNMMAVDEARRRGDDDALFLAQGRIVLECPTSNIWWRRGSVLHTPSLELGILAGVTRAVLVERLPELGYELREGMFESDAVLEAEEAFASSSVREVMPVVALDGRTIGQGTPGPAAQALEGELRRLAQTQ